MQRQRSDVLLLKRKYFGGSSLAVFRLFATVFSIPFRTATAETRVKRQNDDDEDSSTDELCLDRPADEYFRLSADGDCRDVVR